MIIYGRNAIRESLKAKKLQKLLVLDRFEHDPMIEEARKSNVEVKFVSNEDELTRMAKNPSHQGFVAIVKDYEAVPLEDIISSAKGKAYPLVLILDGIEDPQNFGAILRSVDAFGVDGVIIKKRNEVPLNATVAKVSTGAINWVKVAMVSNLSQAIQTLKDHGYWIVASDGSGKQDYDTVDYKSPIGLVVGSEGFGIAPLVLKNSDFIVRIPMCGHVNSLNASVASAILISEIVRSRK
jgi:23S rRNA (guanosine2251-2'-O)-methyltransferase